MAYNRLPRLDNRPERPGKFGQMIFCSTVGETTQLQQSENCVIIIL